MAFPRTRLFAGLCALALAVPAAAEAAPPGAVEVQLLGLNDFHGHIEAGTPGTIRAEPGSPAVAAGGAEYLATHVRALEQDNPNTTVVSAGDLIGASPLLSAVFHDEPTIEAMNRIGLDYNAVGNHEFDEGAAELLRMQNGGCHPTDGCQDGDGFGGADFRFLAANVVRTDTGKPIFAPYAIERYDGIKVGFIGMTLRGTPDIVSPAGIQGLRFLDEAATATKYAWELRRKHGVRAVVVLLHEGGSVTAGGINACNGISGPIVDIVNRTTQQVDLFMTGHTHQAYNCVIDRRPVTSASSNGRLITDVDLTIDRRTKEVIRSATTVDNTIVTQTVMKAPDLTALIDRYTTLVAPLRDRVIGRIAGDIDRITTPLTESPLGDLIADAQLAATASPATGGAVAALMNPGGVRTSLDFEQISGGEAPGEVTFGESFAVQPFGNNLTTITLTGEQLYAVLEQQFCQGTQRLLQPSATLTYTYSAALAKAENAATCGGTTPVSDVRINGVAVDPAASYRITVNSFLADGGDGFTTLRAGTDRLGGAVDTEALSAYLAPSLTGAPVTAPTPNRITVTP